LWAKMKLYQESMIGKEEINFLDLLADVRKNPMKGMKVIGIVDAAIADAAEKGSRMGIRN